MKNIPIRKIILYVILVLFVANLIGFIAELACCNGVFNPWSAMCLSFSVLFFIFLAVYIAYLKVTKYDDKVEQVKPCKYCNSPNDLDARYCKYCGKSFDDNSDSNISSNFGGKNYY